MEDLRDQIFRSLNGSKADAFIVANGAGVIAGTHRAEYEAERLGLAVKKILEEGSHVKAGDIIASLQGHIKAVVMGEGQMIGDLLGSGPPGKGRTRKVKGHVPEKSLSARMMEVERGLLLQALEICSSTRSLAAFLRTSQTSVVRKLKKHRLNHMLERNKQPFLK